MKYNFLGKAGLQVGQLSLGTWLTIGDRLDDKNAEILLSEAYDAGINFFDSAESYNKGQSELALGRLLKKLNWDRSSYMVSSKVFFGDGGTKPNQTGLSRKHVFECCHAALKRMQVEYLDLFFCHRPDKSTPIEETVWAMNHLIQQGKVLYWGTSEWSAQEIMEAHMIARERNLIGPTMEQPQYNMFEREKVENEYSQIYKTVGLGTTIWSPLCSGVLTDKYLDKFPRDTKLFKLMNTIPKMAIAWCLKNPDVSTVILGTSKVAQLKENLDALNWVDAISPDIEERIEEILGNKPERALF